MDNSIVKRQQIIYLKKNSDTKIIQRENTYTHNIVILLPLKIKYNFSIE